MQSSRPLLRSDLGVLKRIDDGGAQGVIYKAPNARWRSFTECVYKEYKADWAPDVNSLARFVAFIEDLPSEESEAILSRAAWPLCLVSSGGGICGFVMPFAPGDLFIDLKKSSGVVEKELAEIQLLLNKDKYLAKRGIPISDRLRYKLLLDLAQGLDLLHSYDIAVRDFSAANTLFSLSPFPRTYFIDCDSMNLQGHSALPPVETDDWDIPKDLRNEGSVFAVLYKDLATNKLTPAMELDRKRALKAADRHKFALLALRLFAQDQRSRGINALPSRVPSGIRHLINESIHSVTDGPPMLQAWFKELESASSKASNDLPCPSSHASANPPGAIHQHSPAIMLPRPAIPPPPPPPPPGALGGSRSWPAPSFGYWFRRLVLGGFLLFALLICGGLIQLVVNGYKSISHAHEHSRQEEALRIAERTRVEQGFQGEWYCPSCKPPKTLTITSTGGKFKAKYPTKGGPLILDGSISPDNRLQLTNLTWLNSFLSQYRGDFAYGAALSLGSDGQTLYASLNGSQTGKTLEMKRKKGKASKPQEMPSNALSPRIAERERVKRGILGEWSCSNGSSARHTTITIIQNGNKFKAKIVEQEKGSSRIGSQTMPAAITADNQLRLINENAGKLMNPLNYYPGEFNNGAWVDLSSDGRYLTVRFSEARGGRSLIMSRKGFGSKGSAASDASDSNLTIKESREKQPSDSLVVGGESASLLDHWPTATECLAAESAPFYHPSLVQQHPLASNEIVKKHPTGGCFELDLPDRMGGRGFVRVEAGREFVFDRTTGGMLPLRLAVSNNTVYSWRPFAKKVPDYEIPQRVEGLP